MFRKHKHKHTELVDSRHVTWTNGGGDATQILLRCECGDLDTKTIHGHWDEDLIRASYIKGNPQL